MRKQGKRGQRRPPTSFIRPWFLFCLRGHAGKRGLSTTTTSIAIIGKKKENDGNDGCGSGCGGQLVGYSSLGRVSFRFLATDTALGSFPFRFLFFSFLSFFFPVQADCICVRSTKLVATKEAGKGASWPRENACQRHRATRSNEMLRDRKRKR